MMIDDDNPWFEPKKFGYGAGPPIAWQGWALLIGYVLLLTVVGALLAERSPIAFGSVLLVGTAVFLRICAAKTRGGWRWRRGEMD